MSSRQAEEQAALVKDGRCATCGKKRPQDLATYCRTHQEAKSARTRKRLGCKPWLPGGRGRPPKWYTSLVRTKGRTAANREATRRAEAV